MKKWDLIIILIFLAASITIFAIFKSQSTDGKCAVISIDGADYTKLPLNKNTTIRIPSKGNDYNIIIVKDGAVTVSDADCPDKICINHPSISKTGETIVCLPHKLSIRISGEDTKNITNNPSNNNNDSIDGILY